MKFDEWEPIYQEICDYFGLDRSADEAAAALLAGLLPSDDLSVLADLIQGRDVTVCGNAPCLKHEIGCIHGTVLAADAAALVLLEHGIHPDAVFTDLDGATEEYLAMNREGTVMVVHAHGDNVPLLRHWAPRFRSPFVATTQAAPLPHVYNFGGFTDGDRAVFAADAMGAASVTITGFDLADPDVDPMKRGKLFWAGKLLERIGYAG